MLLQEEGEEEQAADDKQSQGRVGRPPAGGTPPRSPELLTQEGVTEAAVPPGKHEGEAHRSQSCVQVAATAGLNLGFGLRWCQGNPAVPLQTRPALAWGGLGRAWQDCPPREEAEQAARRPGVGMGLGQGEAASQWPLRMGIPGHPGSSNSAHVRLGLEVGSLLPSNLERPIKIIFSGESFECYQVV